MNVGEVLILCIVGLVLLLIALEAVKGYRESKKRERYVHPPYQVVDGGEVAPNTFHSGCGGVQFRGDPDDWTVEKAQMFRNATTEQLTAELMRRAAATVEREQTYTFAQADPDAARRIAEQSGRRAGPQ